MKQCVYNQDESGTVTIPFIHYSFASGPGGSKMRDEVHEFSFFLKTHISNRSTCSYLHHEKSKLS